MGVETQSIILASLLLLSGFFSGSEVALISLTDAKVQQMVNKKQKGAEYVQKLKDNPQRMLSAILIGNNVCNIAAASLMTIIMIELVGNYVVGIATGLMTFLTLIFGEITPKAIAAQNAGKFARAVAPWLWYLSIIILPVLVSLDWFLTKFLKLLRVKPKQNTISEDEIRHIVTAAQQEGSIKEVEKELIHNIFELDDTTVDEISTPRSDMNMLDVNSNVEEALNIISKKKHSRLPVYDGKKENVVGIVYLRDLINQRKNIKVKKIMKTPYFVPESKKISSLLRNFQSRKEHLSIVVDEHGSITGLVTLEDVLEEIVGEIVDESEDVEINIKRVDKNKWAVSGKTEIEEINEVLHMRVPEGDYETIGGFILERLGRIPKKGTKTKYGRFSIKVEKVKNQRIESVIVQKMKK